MTDKEAIVLEVHISPEHGPRRRYRYTRRDNTAGYWRTEYEWTGCLWRLLDREALTEITIIKESD